MKPPYPIAWRRRAEERKQTLNANIGIQVNADGRISGFGLLKQPSASDEILRAAGFPSQSSKALGVRDIAATTTSEQRASALELAGCFARYIHRGSVIDGASALANRLVETEEYGVAVGLILRANLISSDAPLESWTDLIRLADAVATWLRTGEMSAGFSMLQQAPVSPLDAGVTLGDLVRHGLIRPPEDAPSRGSRTDPSRSAGASQAPRDGEPGSPAMPGAGQ